MVAAWYKADGVAKLLIEAGANLNAKNKVRAVPSWRAQNGDTALMLAVRSGADDVAKLLIEAGAKMNATSKVRLLGVPINMRGGWLACGLARPSPSAPHACMCRGAVVAPSLRTLILPTFTTATAAVIACAVWTHSAAACHTV